MIQCRGLTKRYGERLAVDDLTFDVHPGVVTGFLGPNGAGKSTTMRLILGLDAPTKGAATINGRPYAEASAPLHEVGALLEAKAIHSGRSARSHLLALAATTGIGARRVDEVIALTGLTDVARKRAGGFSLGMGQRLGIASALLGDPGTLILDEPVNGLDPEGILWIRNLLKALAADGRTILVSSHLMSEMALTASHLIVIGRGRLIADVGVDELTQMTSRELVRVRTTDAARLAGLLGREGIVVTPQGNDILEVSGTGSAEIGLVAAGAGIPLIELTPMHATLEEAFMEITKDAVEFITPNHPGGPNHPVGALATAGASEVTR
ncbi:MAG: ATP-binding cassette domain-containing protein [Acidimicrobiales bacterium]